MKQYSRQLPTKIMQQINKLKATLHEQVRDEVKENRHADHAIDPIFLNRWSPRAFSSEPIDDEVLMSVLEAARWAPSSYNEQPWRFLIARSEADRARFLDFLLPMNQAWAKDAPVLLVLLSKKTFSHNDKPNKVYQLDAGTASGYLMLQAVQNDLYVHGMAGFDADKARETLNVPDDYDILAVYAIGKRGETSQLPEEMQEREIPSGRKPLSEIMMEGEFTQN